MAANAAMGPILTLNKEKFDVLSPSFNLADSGTIMLKMCQENISEIHVWKQEFKYFLLKFWLCPGNSLFGIT